MIAVTGAECFAVPCDHRESSVEREMANRAA